MFEEYEELLTWTHRYWLARQDKENLLSFIKGYQFAKKEDNNLIHYIRDFLLEHHQINNEFNTWEEQIEHYAYNSNLVWYQGFFHLLAEISDRKKVLIPTNTPECILVEAPRGEEISQVVLKDGTLLKIGDWIELADKIGEAFKQTKFYDASLRNPSWELFYPSEKDFHHMDMYYFTKDFYPQQPDTVTTFGKVRRLFSQSIIPIKSIYFDKGTVFIYTDLFRIDLEKSYQLCEFHIVDKPLIYSYISDFSYIKDSIDNYLMGLTDATLMKTINHACFYKMNSLKKYWQRFDRSIGGQWWELKKNNS